MDSALSLGDPAGLDPRIDNVDLHGNSLVFGVGGGVSVNAYWVTRGCSKRSYIYIPFTSNSNTKLKKVLGSGCQFVHLLSM